MALPARSRPQRPHVTSRATLERAYALDLRARVVRPMADVIRAVILPGVTALVEAQRSDAWVIRLDQDQKETERLAAAARRKMAEVLSKRDLVRIADRNLGAVASGQAGDLLRSLGESLDPSTQQPARAGQRALDLLRVDPFGSEPWLEVAMERVTRDNVALIKDIPDQTFARLSQKMPQWVRSGLRQEEIAARLLSEDFGELGITTRRASLIARDQVGKFYSQLDETRQTEIGIESYSWETALDERVRGPGGVYPNAVPSHRARQGKVFRWDTPPRESKDDGHAGTPIACRCSSRPVIAGLEDLQANTQGRTFTSAALPKPRPARPTQVAVPAPIEPPPPAVVVPLQPPVAPPSPPPVRIKTPGTVPTTPAPQAPPTLVTPPSITPEGLAPVAAPAALRAAPVVVPDADLSFERSPRSRDSRHEVVVVDLQRLTGDLAQDRGRYVGPGGAGEVQGRVEDAQRFFARARSEGLLVHMSEVALLPGGAPTVIDGRHRLEALRRAGVTHVPVAVPRSQADAVRARFGAGLTRVRPMSATELAAQKAADRERKRLEKQAAAKPAESPEVRQAREIQAKVKEAEALSKAEGYDAETLALTPGQRVVAEMYASEPSPAPRVMPRFTPEEAKLAMETAFPWEPSTYPRANLPKSLSHLSDAHLAAINSYTGGIYKSVNGHLTGTRPAATNGPAYTVYRDLLNDALDRAPKYKGLSYRGIDLSANKLDAFIADYTDAMNTGRSIEWKGFSSTSRDEGAAFYGDVKMRIRSRSGVHVSRISNHPTEDEVLLPAGIKMQVIRVEKDGSNWIVDLVEVDG